MSQSSIGRRQFLGTAALAAAAPAIPRGRSTPAATFRWLGTSGWRIDIGASTLLVDPYLSRFHTGLFDGVFDAAKQLSVAAPTVDKHAGSPQTILVTHTHWDHYNDVPHIAARSGARVFGTLTAYHLGLAYGLPTSQLAPLKGGEVLDFGSYTVSAVAALHSRNANFSMAFPGVRLAAPPLPATIADLPEGDTLAYQVTVDGGPSVFFMGASDFVEHNLTGLNPDVAMIAVPSTDVTHDYVPRLLTALDRPATIVPVHWDNFETPLENPPTVSPSDRKRLDGFVAAVRRVAPRSRVLLPEYLTPYTFG
jgi:L-ascorbate metabolism protein UlaG (beta-lactamase superfamily)